MFNLMDLPMNGSVYVVVSGGSPPSKTLLEWFRSMNVKLVAVDSGANVLSDAKVKPVALLGDLDSINDDALSFIESSGAPILRFPEDKDRTDTQIGLDYCINNGASEIIITGAIGGRLDHSLANLQLLIYCNKRNIPALILEDNSAAFLVSSDRVLSLSFCGDKKKYPVVSLISAGETAKGVRTTGFRWELDGSNISHSLPYAVSNEIQDSNVTVSLKQGMLWVLLQKEERRAKKRYTAR